MRRAALARDPARVTIRGADPARVLSECAAAGIALTNVDRVEEYTVDVTVPSCTVGRIREITQKNQCKVVRVRLSRAGRLLRRGRRRALLVLLLAVACLAAWLSSLFIWEIHVTGNETISEGEILRALDACGVTEGTFWPRMNIDLVRAGMHVRIPELSWFTVNLHGSVADVEVTEAVEPPERLDNDMPVSLVAAHSGVVVKIDALQGQALVQRGDFVTQGQVLVSGSPTDLQGEARGVHALGSVRVRTAYCLTAKTPLSAAAAAPDGNARTRWGVQLGKKRVFFGKSSSIPGVLCDKLYSVFVCAVPGLLRLPVALVRETVAPLSLSDRTVTEKTARARLEQALNDALTAHIGADGEVVSRHFTAEKADGVLTVTLRCECEQEIAVPQPCTVPEHTPMEEGNPND